ncbi:MAG: DDE-type integrase/transposase/recombinase [Gammaproteobacteria bacterium]
MIDRLRTDFPVKTLCDVLGVSRSGFYAWERREPSVRVQGLQGLVVQLTRRQFGRKRFKRAGENLRLNGCAAPGPGQQPAANVTYLKTEQCWCYLAVVLDLYSRPIIVGSLQRTRTTDLSCTAPRCALARSRPERGAIFHTDRGVEYTAHGGT